MRKLFRILINSRIFGKKKQLDSLMASNVALSHDMNEKAGLKLKVKQLESALTNLRLKDAGEWYNLTEENNYMKKGLTLVKCSNEVLNQQLSNITNNFNKLVNIKYDLNRKYLRLKEELLLDFDERKFIGLCDRDGNDIHSGDTMRCKIETRGNDAEELTGIIQWAKYKTGYTLQTKDGRTIANFRCIAGFDVANIKEMPDGRIDGVIMDTEYLKKELDKLNTMKNEDDIEKMMTEINEDDGIVCAPWLAQPKITYDEFNELLKAEAMGEERQKLVDEDFKNNGGLMDSNVDRTMLDEPKAICNCEVPGAKCHSNIAWSGVWNIPAVKEVLDEMDLNMSMSDKCGSCLKLREANLLKVPSITLLADKDWAPEYCRKCYQDERKKYIELKKAFDYRLYLDAECAMKRTPMGYSDWIAWVYG